MNKIKGMTKTMINPSVLTNDIPESHKIGYINIPAKLTRNINKWDNILILIIYNTYVIIINYRLPQKNALSIAGLSPNIETSATNLQKNE